MKRVVLIASVLLAVLTVAAQTPTTLRVDVRLVSVVATVTDAEGKFVPGLSAEDFTVLEDGVAQKISHFTQDHDVPVSVGILLDTSSSMTTKMRTATEAVDRFINYIHPEDDIFLMTFARDTVIEQDFTNDRKKLSRAMNSLHVSGGTVLYDALKEAIDKVRTGRHDKRAILVISDGMDAGSRRTNLESLLRAIRGAEVLVYGLGTGQTVYADPSEHVPFTLPTQSSSARGPAAIQNSRPTPARRGGVPNNMNGVNMSVLNEFAANSGGKAFLLASTFVDTGSSEIGKALTLIADELRGQYTLGYYPQKTDGLAGSGESNFHTIEITTRNGHNVRARTGYQALQ
jgi:VWFA-related protein